MKNKFIGIIIEKQRLLLVSASLILLYLGIFTQIPEVDGELTGFNMDESKYYQNGIDIAEKFGSTTFIQVNIEPTVQDASTVIKSLEKLDEDITDNITGARVESIHKAKKLLKFEESSDVSIKSLLDKSTQLPIVKQIISKDKKSFLCIVFFNINQSSFQVDQINQILEKEYQGLRFKNVMSPYHVEKAIASSIVKDMKVIPGIIILLFASLIMIAYRSLSALVFTMIIIGVSVFPVFYFFSMLQIPLNIITILSIPVLLVLSLADSIHLLTGYRNCNKEITHNEKLKVILKRYFVPSLITSLTTAVAFLSFLFNDAENIQDFGLITAITVLLAFCITYMTAPFLLRYVKPKNIHSHSFNRWFHHLTKNRAAYSILLSFLFIVAIVFLPKLKFNTNLDSFIPRNTKLRIDQQELIKQYYSQLRLEVMVERTDNQPIIDLQMKLRKLHQNIESMNEVGSVNSIKDQIDFKAQYGALSGFVKFPKKNNPFVSEDQRFYRLDIRLKDAKDLTKVDKNIRILAKNYALKNYTYSNGLLINETNSNTADSLFKSLLFSFVFIFGLILSMTRSILYTLAALIANLVPLSSLVLIFYLFKLDLNLLTSVTSVVCLGLIVDDTIHVLYRKIIIGSKLEELSFGIIATSLILFFGFITLALSSFVPSKIFGITSALVFIVTVITDLTLLPYFLDKISLLKKSKSTD